MTLRAVTRPARLVTGITGLGAAAVVFVVFAASAAVFSENQTLGQSPEAVALGALLTAAMLPRVRRLLARLPLGGSPVGPYDAVAEVASRLSRTAPSTELPLSIAAAVERGVDADRVDLVLEDVSSVRSGSGIVAPDHRAVITSRDARLGEIRVYKAGGLTAHEVRLVDDVAAASVIAVSNVVTERQLARRAEEVTATVENIAAALRQTVVAEQHHRRVMAEQVERELAPMFDEVRSHVRVGSLDDAASTAEELIDALRSVSTSVLAGASA